MNRKLFLVTLLLSVLAGCESTGINPRMYYSYQDYLTKPHYRALAVTPSTTNDAFSWAWSANSRTVEGVIERALAGCKKGEKKLLGVTKCRLHSIGDIRVAGMKKEQLDKAMALYTSDKFATNEDLQRTLGLLPETQ